MDITYLVVFCLAGLTIGWLIPQTRRISALFLISLLALYWLQSSSPVRNLDFWLPTASIALTGFVWAITVPTDKRIDRNAIITASVLVAIPLAISLTRDIDPLCCLTPSRPPPYTRVLLGVSLTLILIFTPFLFPRLKGFLKWLAIFAILAAFLVLKSAPLSQVASSVLRAVAGQPNDLASASDLPWLGFSFLAFRLLHILRDSQSNQLPAYSLGDFITYAIFFPSVIAGPIDRSQRFIGNLQRISAPAAIGAGNRARLYRSLTGFQRILIGVFKKFVLADSLAVFALNADNAVQTSSSLWMWALLLAYALRIYFDFAGYTDVALGLARLVDIELPENFDRPYLKTNLTAFWNSWHITLSLWFRTYVFYPLTRSLRNASHPPPAWLVILTGQLITMSLIGLWHGVSWNFLIWGVWHGMGLFIQNRWSDWIKTRVAPSRLNHLLRLGMQWTSWLLTFTYVTLGWAWFALPSPQLTLLVFKKLIDFTPGF